MDKSCKLCGAREIKIFHKEDGFTYLKCQKCGLIFRSQIDLDEMKKFYHDEGVTEDNKLNDYYGKGQVRWLIALDQIQRYKQSGRLFEIGCGGGGLLIEAQQRGFEVYGCDFSKSRVCIINNQLGGDFVLYGDFERLELQYTKKFDVVVMMDVFSHFKNLKLVMNRVAKLLVLGGIVYMKLGNFGEFSSMNEVNREGIDLRPQIHFYHPSPANIKMLIQMSKLQMLRMNVIALHRISGGFFGSERKNYLFQPVSDIIGKVLYRLKIRKAAEVVVVAQK